MKIVSANYMERDDVTHRWLVRDEGMPFESAQRLACLAARGVRFVESKDGESGFGCQVVAVAEEVLPLSSEANLEEWLEGKVRLEFSFDSFYEYGKKRGYPAVEGVRELYLLENGRMYAVLESRAPISANVPSGILA